MGNAVCVRLFASLRERAGSDRTILEFDKRPSIQEVLERILVEIPSLEGAVFKNGRFDERYKIMSGKEFVPPAEFGKRLADETLAILPPVSGG
ncbi:MAG: MoaD/ThiS family protein [Candidatus Methanosuratincola petrocarbonis]|nr:MoaD/ThiS family protein [Candidatus Methanosuratincola sp.]